jgi:superfamily I DNA/RNA helicase
VQTFLAWLAVAVERKEGDRQAVARVLDEDAIELATWHASKGREWPVVAVAGLDTAVKVRLPDLALGYESFEDLSRVLERARVEYAPAFAAGETNANFEAELAPGEIEEARRLLYVALTRPREKLILEWPEYLAGKDSTTYWSVLKEQCDLQLGETELKVAEARFPCVVIAGGDAPPEDATPAALLVYCPICNFPC